jgi:dTDP-4-amino-4,6-dideoxygalactose transaminase
VNKTIPLSVPNLSLDILENVKETIETGWVSTGGRFIIEFENKIARYVGVERAVSCQSGTAGLHLALRVLGIEPGDEVIVPTLTFIAAVNPVGYMGAEPVFMDCDDTLNMDMDKLELFLENECRFKEGKVINKKTGKVIKAIIIVHVFGNPANMERLMDIKEKYGLKVLEDATEAFYPGPGLGGHCIPLDPYYLSWKAREYGFHTSMIESSMMINDRMPEMIHDELVLLKCFHIMLRQSLCIGGLLLLLL